MMTAEDVLEVLDALAGVGVSIWLDGGWGIDALLGYQTRPHDDLDAVIDREDLARARSALTGLGFRHAPHVRPGLPARLVLRDPKGRQVDVHPVSVDSDGHGHQDLGEGRWGLYPAFRFVLRPEFGALAMSASSITVVSNALLLRREIPDPA